MAIRFFDMFAGIGGFRSGLEAVGGFQCVGYFEIDKYVRQAYEAMYDTKGEVYFDDARNIEPEKLPDIDLICGEFPCLSFSIAGKRGEFEDARERCSLKSIELPPLKDLYICSLKMFPAFYRMTGAELLRPSLVRFLNWGTMSHGRCLTARILELPNHERECSLSDFLERDVPEKYFLSQRQMERLLYKAYPKHRETESIPQKD